MQRKGEAEKTEKAKWRLLCVYTQWWKVELKKKASKAEKKKWKIKTELLKVNIPEYM